MPAYATWRPAMLAAVAASFAAGLAACVANGAPPANGSSVSAREGARAPASAQDRGRTDAPAGATREQRGTGTTEGPHEGQRANTPPGKSRDGQPPLGGAIVDPAGAVTGTPPPPGLR